MEFRARYVLMGVLVLAAIAGGFALVYWLNTAGGFGQRTSYRVRFASPVVGLWEGAPVLFNGVRVGEVTRLSLDPAAPSAVLASISVDATAPIRSDTEVRIDFQGLTGVPAVSLVGGSADAGPLAGDLTAPPEATADVLSAARGTLGRIDDILADNREPVRNAIANISTFSDALAASSTSLTRIAEGLEKTFGAEPAAPTQSYRLTPPTITPVANPPAAVLVVETPTAVILYDSQRVIVRSGDAAAPAFESTRWEDSLLLLVQRGILQTLEQAGYVNAGRPEDGLVADDHLLVDIRDFAVVEGEPATARVVLAARLVSADGTIVGAKEFQASSEVAVMDGATAVAGLDHAFQGAAADLARWTMATIAEAVPAAESQP